MKIKVDFITNSSAASFIVYSANLKYASIKLLEYRLEEIKKNSLVPAFWEGDIESQIKFVKDTPTHEYNSVVLLFKAATVRLIKYEWLVFNDSYKIYIVCDFADEDIVKQIFKNNHLKFEDIDLSYSKLKPYNCGYNLNVTAEKIIWEN